jgi:hypothetical protein
MTNAHSRARNVIIARGNTGTAMRDMTPPEKRTVNGNLPSPVRNAEC